MTVTVPVLFQPQPLGNTVAVVGTIGATPANVVYFGGRVRLANTDSASHAVTMYAVPNGGSPTSSNCILNAESVGSNSHADVDLPKMQPGWTLQAFADSPGVVTISELAGALIS